MRIEELKERKRALGYTAKQVAELSGVPLGTVQKIFSGHTKAPRYETLRALEKVLGPNMNVKQGEGSLVREEAFAYAAEDHSAPEHEVVKKQGEYTLEDYFAIPDERRVELIDGVIYDMTAPTSLHQVITQFLFAEIWNFVRSNKGNCLVNIAPTDVHLDVNDNKTMVQPDVLVTCDRSKVTIPRIEGAPDLVIEVLSPSTRRKDISVKVNKYAETGVRELWLVDPRDRRVIVYDFENEDIINIYTFRDKVPVLIFGGELTIDLAQLSDYLDDLYGDTWWER